MKKDKKTKYDPQNTTQKIENWATLKTVGAAEG
jgi:hypothetical protein